MKPFFLVFSLILLGGAAYLLSLPGEGSGVLAFPLLIVGGIVLFLVGVDLVRNRVR